MGGEEEDLRGGQGKEMTLVQTPEEKKVSGSSKWNHGDIFFIDASGFCRKC